MKKYAFTMLELIFVIVVIGIITAVMIPRMNRDNVFEAAQQLQTHIKLAQHLSIVDNAYDDTNPTWYYSRWGIAFDTDVKRYRVKHSSNGTWAGPWVDVSDSVGGALNDVANSASDIGSRFNIDAVNFTGGCAGAGVGSSIFFDNIGRPYYYADVATYQTIGSPQANLLTSACNIQVVSGTKNVTVTIQPETGYTSITNFN